MTLIFCSERLIPATTAQRSKTHRYADAFRTAFWWAACLRSVAASSPEPMTRMPGSDVPVLVGSLLIGWHPVCPALEIEPPAEHREPTHHPAFFDKSGKGPLTW